MHQKGTGIAKGDQTVEVRYGTVAGTSGTNRKTRVPAATAAHHGRYSKPNGSSVAQNILTSSAHLQKRRGTIWLQIYTGGLG